MQKMRFKDIEDFLPKPPSKDLEEMEVMYTEEEVSSRGLEHFTFWSRSYNENYYLALLLTKKKSSKSLVSFETKLIG